MSAPLRILLASHFFAPSGETGGNRATALARHLREAGHDVTVLTTRAYGELAEDERAGNLRTYDLQLVQARLRGGERASDAFSSDTYSEAVHPLSRILVPDAHSLAWTPFAVHAAKRELRHRDFDCVLTTSPPESAHRVGIALARRGVAWVADLRDGWSFEPWIKEQLWPLRAQHHLNERLERRALTRAHAVTAVTTIVLDDLRDRLGIDGHLVPNGWEPSPEPPADSRSAPELDPRRVSVIYTGRLAGGRKDPAPLLQALELLAERDPAAAAKLELVFAGSFTAAEQALFAADLAPAVVRNVGRLDRAAVAELQRRADAAVLITSPERRQESGSKLFEYIGAGLPILALARADSAAAEIVGGAGGLVVPTHDVEAIAAGLSELAAGRVGSPPEELRRSYSWPAIAERMAEVMREAMKRRQALASARS